MEPEHTDFIATELLKELKDSNARKDAQIAQQQKDFKHVICFFLIVIAVIVGGFLLYLNQYDFSSSEEYTYTATGVYALVDNEGNVIAQDLSPEEMKEVLEVLDGYGEGHSEGQED